MPDYIADSRATTELLRDPPVTGKFLSTAALSVAYTAMAEQLALQNILTTLITEDNILRLTNTQADLLVSKARVILGFSA